MTRKQSIVIDISWPFDDIVTWWKRSLSSLGRALSIAPRMMVLSPRLSARQRHVAIIPGVLVFNRYRCKAALPLVEQSLSTRRSARWLTLNAGCGM